MADLVLSDKPSKETDWKPIAFVLLGFAFGMLAAYQLRTEDNAKAMASEICKVDKQNVEIMVKNFNVLAQSCAEARTGMDFLNNKTKVGWLNAS